MDNLDDIIKGLEWILEDDKFGFGHGWSEEDPPQCEEEQAGYNIEKAIKLLKEQKEIIDKYSKVDMFLAVHGWQWKETATESSMSPKDGEQE